MNFILRSYGSFPARLTGLKNCLHHVINSREIFIFKMALPNQFRFVANPITNIISIMTVLLQLHGILLIWSVNEKRKQLVLMSQLLIDRKKELRRLKMARKRKVNIRSCWFKPGRTDLWRQILITGVTPKEFWKEKFLMDETSFLELVSCATC